MTKATDNDDLVRCLRNEVRGLQAELSDALKRETRACHRLGNLLAVIFRDGGHRQQKIDDDDEAVRQAIEEWAKLRKAVEES